MNVRRFVDGKRVSSLDNYYISDETHPVTMHILREIQKSQSDKLQSLDKQKAGC